MQIDGEAWQLPDSESSAAAIFASSICFSGDGKLLAQKSVFFVINVLFYDFSF